MSYVLIVSTDVSGKDLVDAVWEYNQNFMRWAHDGVKYCDKLLGVQIGIKDWKGGNEEEVKEYAQKVVDHIKKVKSNAYTAVVDIRTK